VDSPRPYHIRNTISRRISCGQNRHNAPRSPGRTAIKAGDHSSGNRASEKHGMKCIFGNNICGKLAVARHKTDIFNTPFEGGADLIIHKKTRK
jgi:hypothetical protein